MTHRSSTAAATAISLVLAAGAAGAQQGNDMASPEGGDTATGVNASIAPPEETTQTSDDAETERADNTTPDATATADAATEAGAGAGDETSAGQDAAAADAAETGDDEGVLGQAQEMAKDAYDTAAETTEEVVETITE